MEMEGEKNKGDGQAPRIRYNWLVGGRDRERKMKSLARATQGKRNDNVFVSYSWGDCRGAQFH